jgi:hypothetical protein
LSPFETKYKHVLSDYINLHPLRNRSDSAPYPISEKICIRNRIRAISTPIHIRQKNMDADEVKVFSDPLLSLASPLSPSPPISATHEPRQHHIHHHAKNSKYPAHLLDWRPPLSSRSPLRSDHDERQKSPHGRVPPSLLSMDTP